VIYPKIGNVQCAVQARRCSVLSKDLAQQQKSNFDNSRTDWDEAGPEGCKVDGELRNEA